MFALAVVSLSWLFFVAIPVVLMLALLVHGGAVTGSWWRRTLSARSLGWVARRVPHVVAVRQHHDDVSGVARLPVAALAGCANAGSGCTSSTRCSIVDGLRVRSRWRRSASPVCLLSSSAGPPPASRCEDARPALRLAGGSGDTVEPGRDGAERAPLVVVTGFNTKWDGRADSTCTSTFRSGASRTAARRAARRFRTPPTTPPPLPASCARCAAKCPCTTGRPAGVSRSSPRAKARCWPRRTSPRHRRARRQPRDPQPAGRARTRLLPLGGNEGWGAAGALAMEGFAWALGGVSPVDVTPDTPFLRSIVDDAPALRG